MDAFGAARLVIGAGFLAAAALADVRTRRVRDPLWVVLGSLGLVLLALQLALDAVIVNDWLLLASATILFYAVFYGKPVLDEDGAHLRPARVLLLTAAAVAFLAAILLPHPLLAVNGVGGSAEPFAQLLSVPVMVLVYQGFYQVELLRGGADTKALIALTLLVPQYPDASPFPILQPPPAVNGAMQLFFPFSLVIFVNAAILMLAVPVAYLLVNVARGEFEWPVGFLGTKVPIDAVPRHAWVMERIDAKGERYAVLFPSRKADESDEIETLRAAGLTRIWVETKIPFILLLLLGFLLAFVVGNVLLGFLTAVLPAA